MASPTRWSSTYRCPNVPAEIPLDLAFCNYTDCHGCSSQRAIRMADVPEPDPSLDFDDRDPHDWERDDGDERPDAREYFAGSVAS